MFDQLTSAELAALETSAYNGSVRLFTASSELYSDMAEMGMNSPAYAETGRRARVLLSAGREQSDLHAEVRAEQRARTEAEQALRARIAAALSDPGNMTPAALLQFEANWSAE